jgi:SAM-dependent methyltransferase
MITELPVVIERPDRSATWGEAAVDHPMRKVTRAVAFEPDAWTPERQAEVAALFDELAPGWNSRDVPDRHWTIDDALDRGLAAAPVSDHRVALELGGGTGLNLKTIGERFETIVTLDLSSEMLRLAPPDAARVQGDGSRLPLADGSVDALILINMFLFPAEADRVVSPHGVVVWINSRGPETPIHLTAEEVDGCLPGEWDGVASTAGHGTWSVHWRAS